MAKSNQFEKIVKSTAYSGVASYVLANVKDKKQQEDIINLYELQKATGTFDREEFQDLLIEIADPLKEQYNQGGEGAMQGPMPLKETKKKVSKKPKTDDLDALIGEVQGKPKAKPSAAKVMGAAVKPPTNKPISPDKLIPPKSEEEVEEGKQKKTRTRTRRLTSEAVEQLAVNINVIARELNTIGLMMSKELKEKDKRNKRAAQEALAAQRNARERGREKQVEQQSRRGGDFKVPQVAENIFDKIKKFVGNILAGSAILGLVKWLKDEENQKKINQVLTFVQDNMPIILGGLLAFATLKIGSTLLGIVGAIKSGLLILTGLLGPAGLLGVLGALSIVAGAFLLDKYVKPMIQNLAGGSGFTQSGLVFGLEDINDLRNEFNQFANDSGMTYEQKKPRLDKFKDLEASMRENKRINDNLFRAKEQLKMYEEKLGTPDGDRSGAQAQINRLNKLIAKLENDKRYSNKIVTQRWMDLQISESDLERTIRSNDRDVVRTPGAVDASLRRPQSTAPTTGSPDIMSPYLSAVSSSAGITPATDDDSAMLATDVKAMSDETSAAAMGLGTPSSDAFTSPSLSTGDYSVNKSFTSQNISGPSYAAKMGDAKPIKFDIGPPPIQTPTVIPLGGGGKPSSSPISGASGNQKTAPSFSAADPNNESFEAIYSIYNVN